jgi:hypothetical protein
MWYELVLRDEIEDEVVEIASWFETRKEGEGIRFVLQFVTIRAIVHVRRNPDWVITRFE